MSRRPLSRYFPGEVYGNWTVIAKGATGKKRLCRCVCGTEMVLTAYRLALGEPKSCGCLRKRHLDTRERRCWRSMRARCQTKGHKDFPKYGGRGIRVCGRWKGADGFSNFLADMGPAPSPKHTIDRIDNQKGYEPGNCRWATMAQQARNRNQNRFVDFKGQRLAVMDLAERYGISHGLLKSRLYRGWTPEEAAMGRSSLDAAPSTEDKP